MVQSILADCESDVLLLCDCCHAVPVTTFGAGRGIKEYLSACGFEGRAAEVGQDSFTYSLVQELGRVVYSPGSISVAELYGRLIGRLRTWKPRIVTDEQSGEMRFAAGGRPVFE